MNCKLKYFISGLIVMGFLMFPIFAMESNIIQDYQNRLSEIQCVNCTQELYNQSLAFGNYTIEKGDKIGIYELSKMLGENLTYNIVYADNYYYLVKNVSDVREFLKYDNTDTYPYIKTDFDCDDYSWMLLGRWQVCNSEIAFGVMYIYNNKSGHAVNFFVDNNYTIWIVEPQTDGVYRLDDIRNDWNVRFAVVN